MAQDPTSDPGLAERAAAAALALHVATSSSPDARARDRAARALGELRVPGAIDALAAAAAAAPHSHDVIWALTQFDDARVAPALVAALHAPSETVRWMAAAKLGDLAHAGGEQPLPPLAAPLLAVLRSDRAPGVREQAARGLGFAGDPAAIPALLHALRRDRSAPVREAAAAALGELRAHVAVDALARAERDRHAAVRRAATAALRRLRPPS